MAVTETTVTGPIYIPNLTKPENAKIVFELSSWDREEGEATFVTGPFVGDIDENGNFSVNLFTTTEGVNQAVYHVSVTYLTMIGKYTREYLGSIALAGPGPYNMADLNFVDPSTTASFDVLAEITAYLLQVETTRDETIEAVSGVIIPATSRVQLKETSTSFGGRWLVEGLRSGYFIWNGSIDVATHQTDTLEGMYVAPDALSNGAWVRKLDGTILNVLSWGADPTGVSDSLAAFQAAIDVAKLSARSNYSEFYDAMFHPLTCDIMVPEGIWNLSNKLDPKGMFINWHLAAGADFPGNTEKFLNGPIRRPTRENLFYPHGQLDSTAAKTFNSGVGYFGHNSGVADQPAAVNGWIDPDNACVYLDEGFIGLGGYAASIPAIECNVSSYTSTSASLTGTLPDPRDLRVGMQVQTNHAGTPYRGLLVDWASDGSQITVHKWLLLGDLTKTAQTPTGTDGLLINVFAKVWGGNFMSFLLPDGFSYQTAGIEAGVWNNKVAPVGAQDGAGRSWVYDGVNLGPLIGSSTFIARGAFHEGFTASTTNVGFSAHAFPAVGLVAAPSVGYEYIGAGTILKGADASGNQTLLIHGNSQELGPLTNPNSYVMDFHTSGGGGNDFDGRILVYGGTSGIDGQGVMQLQAGTLNFAGPLIPALDATYPIGGPSNRITVLYAQTGSINTSDPKTKRFLSDDESDKEKLYKVLLEIDWLPYVLKDSEHEKGRGNARIHWGINARALHDDLKRGGIENPFKYAFLCEDDEYETVTVEEFIEEPEYVIVQKETHELVDCGDHFESRVKLVEEREIRKEKIGKPVLDEDGQPVMIDAQAEDDTGNPKFSGLDGKGNPQPIKTKIPVIHYPIVMRKKRVEKTERRKTGEKLMGIRYEELLAAYLAALGSKGIQESKID